MYQIGFCMELKIAALDKIKKIKIEIEHLGLKTTTIEERQYNFEFSISSAQDKLKIQVYFGKKGVKTIIQGNKDSVLYSEVYPFLSEQELFAFPKENISEPDEYIGSDESGKGDVFGPLVIGAFYVNKNSKISLAKLGVRDSKELTESQINSIAINLKKKFPDDYEIVAIYPEKYNELYKKFNNLNSIMTWAHSKAINNLLQSKACTEVISDKFSNKLLNIDLDMNSQKVNLLQIPKAEKHLGVAAASIMARYVFNSWFIKQKSQGFTLPKGASEAVNIFIKKNHTNGNSNQLKKIAKLHFKNIKKLL